MNKEEILSLEHRLLLRFLDSLQLSALRQLNCATLLKGLSEDELTSFLDILVQYCPNLTLLNLSQNQLSTLPSNISEIRSLNELILDSNQLKELPSSLQSLTRLTTLHLKNNPLLTDFSKNQCSEGFSMIDGVLDLNNKALQSLPEFLCSLSGMSFLKINGNHLSELPSSLPNLSSLKYLDISKNRLNHRPTILSKLSLEYVDLSDNPFLADKRILSSTEIRKLKKLLQHEDREMLKMGLSMWGSVFSCYDEFKEQLIKITAKKDKTLYSDALLFDRLHLMTLFERFSFPQYLALWTLGTLAQFPECRKQMRSFTELKIAYSHWSRDKRHRQPLSELPPELLHCTHLSSIEINFKKIIGLPEELGQHKKLQSITIHNAPTLQLDDGIGRFVHLRSLTLQNCALTGLPPGIGDAKNLRSLSLQNNNIQTLPEEINRLTNLHSLDLSFNPSLHIDAVLPILCSLTSLRHLSLGGLFGSYGKRRYAKLRDALPKCTISKSH